MILKRLQVQTGKEHLITNTYVVCDEEDKEAIVIDPGGEPEKVLKLIEILGASLKYIYLTHCHADHINSVNRIQEEKGGIVLISRDDYDGLTNKNINMSDFLNMDFPKVVADSRLDDGDVIHVGNLEFKVILTPGHTQGSSSLYCESEKMIFTGDTLFAGTVGRTDLPTGNYENLISSIKEKLLILPEETIVYPGHGRITKIGDEKSQI